MRSLPLLLLACAPLLLSRPCFAQTWSGATNSDWATGSNWSGGSVPAVDSGANAVINTGAIQYNAGPDFTLGGGGSFTLNGGSWTQIGGISWINIGNAGTAGTLNVAGGTFNMGTAGNIRIGFGGGAGVVNVTGGSFVDSGGFDLQSSGSFLISGGTASVANNLVVQSGSTFGLSGTGALTVGNEFQPDHGSMTGGTMNISNILAFQSGAASFTLSSGQMNIARGDFFDGIFAPAGSYLNFNSGSTGILFIDNRSTIGSLLTDGRIRIDGVTNASAFDWQTSGSGIQINLLPEPTPIALLLLSFCSITVFHGRSRRR